MIKITSKDNQAVRRAMRLMTSARERRKAGLIICEGARLCRDAADSGVEVEELLCTQSALRKYSDYLDKLMEKAHEAYEISDDIAKKISDTENTQGVFIVAKSPAVENNLINLKNTGQYVLLENLQDPSNVGAVFRTIYYTVDAPADMAAAAERNMRPMAAVPRDDAADVTGIRFFRGAIMCIGNEGNGLSEALIGACPEKVTIPMNGRAESLNAATAAAILMWEMMRGYISK